MYPAERRSSATKHNFRWINERIIGGNTLMQQSGLSKRSGSYPNHQSGRELRSPQKRADGENSDVSDGNDAGNCSAIDSPPAGEHSSETNSTEKNSSEFLEEWLC